MNKNEPSINNTLGNLKESGIVSKSEPQKYVPPHLRNSQPEEKKVEEKKFEEKKYEKSEKKSWDTKPQEPLGTRWKDKGESTSDRFKSFSPGTYKSSYNRYVEDKEEEIFKNVKEDTGINFEKYNDIPVEMSGEDCPKSVTCFEDLNIEKKVYDNVVRAKYKSPTPIQKFAIPGVLRGRDIMACAQTGSGKTCAFLCPIVSCLVKDKPKTDNSKYVTPSCIILSPTRELALQIHEEAKKFCFKTGIIPQVIYGGEQVRDQIKEIFKGCDVLVATPGRLLDLIERGKISLAHVRHFVLDEADKMLDMGFEPQIRQIVEKEDLPKTGKRQTLMFSATFPREIQGLASDFLDDYIFLTVGIIGSTSNLICQKFEYIREDEKKDLLLGLLKRNPSKTLVFVETKKTADELEYFLSKNGVKSDSIHGDKTQQERIYSLNLFKSGKIDALVATSVASRGLDIDNVSHVINFDLPSQVEDYVHRIGRTGRCGNDGLATSFFTEKNKNILKDLYKKLKDSEQEIPNWMEKEMKREYSSSYKSSYGNSRGKGRGNKFGSTDYRKKSSNNYYDTNDDYFQSKKEYSNKWEE